MRTSITRIRQLVGQVEKEGPTVDNLRKLVVLLADEVITLHYEVDRLQSVANRAERMSRLGMAAGVRR